MESEVLYKYIFIFTRLKSARLYSHFHFPFFPSFIICFAYSMSPRCSVTMRMKCSLVSYARTSRYMHSSV